MFSIFELVNNEDIHSNEVKTFMLSSISLLKKLILFMSVLLVVTACSNTNEKRNSMQSYSDIALNRTSAPEETAVTDKGNQTINKSLPDVDRKVIKTANLDLETKQFGNTIHKLENSVTDYSGFIESNHVTGTSISIKHPTVSTEGSQSRSAQYSIRIPTLQLNEYLDKLSKIGNVISKTISTEDISNQYIDTEKRLNSLNIQEERLIKLLKKSGTLKDIIELEKELTNVRYEIESLTATKKQFDSLVDYSTINLSIIEVSTMTDTTPPKTMNDRISAQFKQNIEFISNGFKNITVFLIGNSLLILFWITILLALYYITRRAIKKTA